MNAAAQKMGTPAGDQYLFKTPLPAVPRRGYEAGFHRIYYDFQGQGVPPIDSCLFLQSQKFDNSKIRFEPYQVL